MTDYGGHVDPGGPAISRRVEAGDAAVEVSKLSVGPMDNNVYLLTDLDSRESLLIDAANDPERILREVEGVTVAAILTTHGHPDHWQALEAVAEATAAPVHLHPGDQPMVPRAADRPAGDGDVITFGAAEIELLHTPGHTPGSVCALLGGTHLFTGDTLFPGGLGRSTPETFPAMFDTVVERLFSLPDDTWVYPGHGDDTTIGTERPYLDEWRQRGW